MYRIVAADSHAPRDGRFIETLGHYHPLTHPATVVFNQERVDHWIRVGAQPTDVVRRLLKRAAEAPAPETAAPASRRTRATPAPTPVAEAPAAEIPAAATADAAADTPSDPEPAPEAVEEK